MMGSLPPAGSASVVERLRGKLVVSCQAPPGHPFSDLPMIIALCQCAAQGGAAGLRVEGVEAVRAARSVVGLPVIGLRKVWDNAFSLSGSRPAITPQLEDAVALAAAGAEIVALEATAELHGGDAARYVSKVCGEVGALVMADVSNLEEGLLACEAGAHLVSTTLSGYTSSSLPREGPDLALVAALADRGVPTVAEGYITSPQQALSALEAGAVFVVVGKSITDPLARTAAFVATLSDRRSSS